MFEQRENPEPGPPAGQEAESPIRSFVVWTSSLSAVLFNTGFSILAIVTLCGIVFITRPKQVMHEIAPEAWLPLLIVMGPAQIYALCLSWSTVFAGIAPTALAIALRQRNVPRPAQPALAWLWMCNFVIGFGIVVSLAKPNPGNPQVPPAAIMFAFAVAYCLASAAHVYLLLAIRTLTAKEDVLNRVWKHRAWINAAMATVGAIYYRA